MKRVAENTEKEAISGVGPWIRAFRDARGIPQTAIIHGANLSPATVSKIENGKHEPTKDSLAKIAAALGLPYDVLWKVRLGAKIDPAKVQADREWPSIPTLGTVNAEEVERLRILLDLFAPQIDAELSRRGASGTPIGILPLSEEPPEDTQSRAQPPARERPATPRR
jgi:transcriptional regulator with XRE-family HTH domain